MDINSFVFPNTRIEDHNPLDYLEDEFALKRKPRSSMESNERREIPICEPPYISRRRDSKHCRMLLDMHPHSP